VNITANTIKIIDKMNNTKLINSLIIGKTIEKIAEIIGPIILKGNNKIFKNKFSSPCFFLKAPLIYFSILSRVISYPFALIFSSTVFASDIEIHNSKYVINPNPPINKEITKSILINAGSTLK